MVLERAAHHRGTAFVEIYQDCNVFNSGAFEFASKKDQKVENCIYLEDGKPLVFGAKRERGIRLNGKGEPEVVNLSEVKEDDLLFHNETADDSGHAYLLARMRWPNMPEPMGVFRCIEKPTYDAAVTQQMTDAIARSGEGNLEALFQSGDTWVVE